MISLKVGSLTALSSKLGLKRADPAKAEQQARPEPKKARALPAPSRAPRSTRAQPSAFRPKLVLASASPRRWHREHCRHRLRRCDRLRPRRSPGSGLLVAAQPGGLPAPGRVGDQRLALVERARGLGHRQRRLSRRRPATLPATAPDVHRSLSRRRGGVAGEFRGVDALGRAGAVVRHRITLRRSPL